MECSLRTFGPSITHKLIARVLTTCHVPNLRKAQRWSKSVLTFDRCRLHSVNFWFLLEGKFYCSRSFALDSALMKFNLKITRDIETRNL